MEYLDVVDENNNLIGKNEERNIIHEKGIWHREVAVWIMNEKGEVLLQKRAASKKQYPNKWAICAGHIDAGESHEAAIIREMNEEIGMTLAIDDLEFLGVYISLHLALLNKLYNLQFSNLFLKNMYN